MPSRSERTEFMGGQGHVLAARLDRPTSAPTATVVFAHCFTCSKDIFAASRIAGALTERGLAVLRFDFTGLGASGGDFANSNFSSNVDDLVAACRHLSTLGLSPDILLGHSLGGAAVLAAASKIPEARAVATIGAPFDAAHVIEHFDAALPEIERDGSAKVLLAGREFTIARQLIDDLQMQPQQQRIAELRRPLLVMHAPRDEVVGIDNASAIFAAARHPKSFVSLDDADHLLTRKRDAIYVADVLAAWASRFVQETGAAGPDWLDGAPDGVVRVGEAGGGRFQQRVLAAGHRLLADEPVADGGLGSGPSPYDFLAIALGACTAMTLRLYAERKGIALQHVAVDVAHDKIHAKDCVECGEGRVGQVDRFERVIHLQGTLSEAERARLLEIADKCPVHRTLEASSVIATRLE